MSQENVDALTVRSACVLRLVCGAGANVLDRRRRPAQTVRGLRLGA